MTEPIAGGFRMGDLAIQPSRGRIVSLAGETRVEPRAMDVLVALARRAGETVSRDDLIDAVWKHPYVSDEALSRCISMLRRALGDGRSQPRYLETVPKRGYRLVASVEIAGAALPSSSGLFSPPEFGSTNIPLQQTPILGRESELAEVRELLANRRLVTLTGSGGVGKTRLALEIGSQSVHDFADGVWLVELAPVSDPGLIPGMVAAAAGIELGHARTLKALIHGIARRNVLVILDNCEHLIDAAAALAEAILGAAPGVRLLTTSQMLLGIGGEQAFHVPSLAVPDESRHAAEEIIGASAVQLFVERAKLADPHFRLVNGNAAPVAAICRRLEGIPLAIEMAAARAPMLGADELAQLLDERFRVLTGGRRTALPRHQTLRATLDWSFGLLTKQERTVFNRLGVFAGGFTLEAALAVVSNGEIDRAEVADVLTHLISRSLVVAHANAIDARYRLLETTRAYALERLDEEGDGDRVRARHLDYYLALADEASLQLRGKTLDVWLARLDLERENLLAAHAWCGRSDEAAEPGLRLVSALAEYWLHRGLLALAHRVTVEALTRRAAQARSPARCGALTAAGLILHLTGRHADAQGYLEDALVMAHEIGDEPAVARALRLLGVVAYSQGNHSEARGRFQQALPVARRLGTRGQLGGILAGLAELHRLEGNLETAERVLEEAVALARASGSATDIGVGLLNLAAVSIGLESPERAREMLREVLAIGEESGTRILIQGAIETTAGLAAHREEWKRAARLFGTARAQLEQMGMQPEPVDEAFLAPLIEKARDALGAEAFAAAEASGRAFSYEAAIAELRAWLPEGRTSGARDSAMVSRSAEPQELTPCGSAAPSGIPPRETRARPGGRPRRRSGR